MIKDAIKQLKTALMLLLVMTCITGLLYPLVITGFAQLFFPWQANGSILSQNGKSVGSVFIGQSFLNPGYFWGRPSATMPFPYNAEASSGSNIALSNPAFIAAVKERVSRLKETSTQPIALIPVDLVTASGSGLDPEITPAAALYQVPRIAKYRHIDEQAVRQLIAAQCKKRDFSLLGEPRINVLQLNLALNNLRERDDRKTPNA